MFGKLKEKLKGWAKKLSEKTEEKVPEAEKSGKDVEETPKKEIQMPTKFEVGSLHVKPDLEKLEEITKDLGKAQVEVPLEEPENIKQIVEDAEGLEKLAEKPQEKRQGFFGKLKSKVTKTKISEKEFEIYSEELKMLLLENNVAFEVAEKMINELKESIVGKDLLKKEIESEIKEVLKEIIREILIEPIKVLEKIKEKSEKPFVILFCGINGTGKTTTIAKFANYLKENNISCILAAGDTFRAASIEQIKKHGEKLGVKVISQDYGSDPAAVGFDAVKYAKKNRIDCVLIDTAGRMHSEKNLLKELEKISRICSPDLKIFVGEAIAGNDSVEQVKSFNWAIGIDGIILTKADTDEKGGTALSVGHVTKKPILYLGTGQEYDKIEVFDKEKFLIELGL